MSYEILSKKHHYIEELANDKLSFNFVAFYNSSYQISIIIPKSLKADIKIEVSEDWLFNQQEWNFFKWDFDSNIGTRNRIIKTFRRQAHIKFYKTIDITTVSSRCFMTKDCISFLSKSEFSVIFNSFSQSISDQGLPKNEDTDIILEYIDNFCKKQNIYVPNSLFDLEKHGINGYFNLVLSPITFHLNLQTFCVNENEFYIHFGVYIMNKAALLFERNQNIFFDGFILDTTWKAIPKYVTSILNVCFNNTSLPIAFAFGRGKTIFLYNLLLQNVQDQLNIQFPGKYLESDEGSALHSIGQKYSLVQLSCLRHFLAKLKKLDYFFEIKQLLICTSQIDFENCIQNLTDHFKTTCNQNPDEFTKINKILGKIGLLFCDDQITIENETKWEKVSLLHRVDAHMPSTTNTLEAMHGHINENCPRRNSFFSAIQR